MHRGSSQPDDTVVKVLRCYLLLLNFILIGASFQGADAAADIVDRHFGIGLQARTTAQSGVVLITWQVSAATFSAGANDFELQFFVGGSRQ